MRSQRQRGLDPNTASIRGFCDNMEGRSRLAVLITPASNVPFSGGAGPGVAANGSLTLTAISLLAQPEFYNKGPLFLDERGLIYLLELGLSPAVLGTAY